MNKKKAKAFLVDYLNGHGSPEERMAMAEWLEKDASIQQEARLLSNEMDLLRTAVDDPMQDVHLTHLKERVMAEVREQRRGTFSHLAPAWRSYLRAMVAVCLGLVAFVVVFLIKPAEQEIADLEPIQQRELIEPKSQPERELKAVRLVLTTENPKVKIYWTLSDEFVPLGEGE